MRRKFLLFAFAITIAAQSIAQFTSEYQKSAPTQNVYGYRADYGSTIVHTPAVKAIGGARPYGFGFEWSKQAKDSATYHRTSAYPRYGFQFNYFHYGTPILGNSFMASYFIHPVYRISNRLSFFYQATFGFSYSDNPFNPDSPIDTLNQCYSLRINPYLQLASGFGIKLSDKVTMELTGNFNHISNGNVKRPNRGLNWVTSSVSLLYNPSGSILPKYTRVHNKYWKGRPWNYSLGLLYVSKQDYAGFTMGYQRTFAAGGYIEAAKQIGRIHGFIGGLQVYHNNLVTDDPNPILPVIARKHTSVLAGLYAGHEFLLGRIIISQVIGRYVTEHPAMYNNYFHQHSLRYMIDKHWITGFCFRAHEDEADFIGLNMMYRL